MFENVFIMGFQKEQLKKKSKRYYELFFRYGGKTIKSPCYKDKDRAFFVLPSDFILCTYDKKLRKTFYMNGKKCFSNLCSAKRALLI